MHDGDNVSSKHFSHSLVPGLIVLNTLSYRSHYYSHFTDEDTEAQLAQGHTASERENWD